MWDWDKRLATKYGLLERGVAVDEQRAATDFMRFGLEKKLLPSQINLNNQNAFNARNDINIRKALGESQINQDIAETENIKADTYATQLGMGAGRAYNNWQDSSIRRLFGGL